jgi:hypothetical protein
MDSLVGIASGRDHCGMDGCTEESDTGVVATTGFQDFSYSNKVSRHITIKIT